MIELSLKIKSCRVRTDYVVGSMDQESSQQLEMWFSEHFFAPKLVGLFVTPIVSSTSNKYGAKKCLKNHILFDF